MVAIGGNDYSYYLAHIYLDLHHFIVKIFELSWRLFEKQYGEKFRQWSRFSLDPFIRTPVHSCRFFSQPIRSQHEEPSRRPSRVKHLKDWLTVGWMLESVYFRISLVLGLIGCALWCFSAQPGCKGFVEFYTAFISAWLQCFFPL